MLVRTARSSVATLTLVVSHARQHDQVAPAQAEGVQGANGGAGEGRFGMDEEKERQEEDTEGSMPFSRVSAEGADEDDTEGQARRGLAADDSEDDTEGPQRA